MNRNRQDIALTESLHWECKKNVSKREWIYPSKKMRSIRVTRDKYERRHRRHGMITLGRGFTGGKRGGFEIKTQNRRSYSISSVSWCRGQADPEEDKNQNKNGHGEGCEPEHWVQVSHAQELKRGGRPV